MGQYEFCMNFRRDHSNLMVFTVVISLLGVIFALGMGNVSAASGDTSYDANPKNGGAIYNDGSLTVNNCTFTNNKATDVGVIILWWSYQRPWKY
jgi:hypothetical protein